MCQSVRWVTSANIMGIVSTPHAPRRMSRLRVNTLATVRLGWRDLY